MHLRKLVLVCGFAVTLLANYANALGLGEITLNSSLNQPLNAEIKLLDVRDLTADQIIVALGSPADFERNGVDRLFFYSEFGFEVLLNNPGGAVVRITTRNPVREPFLNFLVEARWSTGRLLREYTLLMDLPTFGDTPAAPVESATSYPQNISQPRTSSTVKSPVSGNDTANSESQTSTAPAQRSGGNRAGSDSYGPVNANDTLWQIALEVRPDRNLSIHQTMLAIQRLNPEAFINGNINLLRKGQVLRLPSADEIRSVSRNDAVAEVTAQNRDWSENTMGAQLNASRRETSTRREAEAVSGRVKLAAPETEAGSSGQGSGGDNGDGRALENQLAGTLEELDKTRSENSELASRVRDLEEQIETMERLVDVSNEQLRAMQLAASQQAEREALADTAPAETTAPTGDVGSTESPELAPLPDINADTGSGSPEINAGPETAGETPTETSAQPEPVIAEPEPVVAEPVAPPARDVNRVIPAKPKTLVDHLYDNALWVALALLAVLVAVLAVVQRRRRDGADNADESSEDNDLFTMPDPVDDAYDEDEMQDSSADLEAEDMPSFDEEDLPAEAETGDVVGEADIYIAYGKYEQAEEMLLNGLAKEPDSVDIRLKLLEVYSQTRNIGRFDTYYASLVGIASHGALQRAAELRGNIPGAGEFEGDLLPASTSSNGLAASDDLIEDETLDFGLDEEVYSEPTQATGVQADEDEFSFDLDLDDEPLAGEGLAPESDIGKSSSRYDLSFEEDLDVTGESEDEFSLDLDSDDDLGLNERDEVATETLPLDDDLGELSFELDDDNADVTDAPAQPVAVELETSEDEEEFSFDFDDDDKEAEPLDEDDNFNTPVERAPVAATSEDADEFNIDMDMDDLDLEALDHEMESLDAEFGQNDESDFAALDVELDQGFAETEPGFEEESPDEPGLFAEDDPELEEDLFEQALSDSSAPVAKIDEMPDIASLSDDDMDAELDFLADTDEAATKLDLARAYIDMGDADGARDILSEVAQEGNQQQRDEAKELLGRIEA